MSPITLALLEDDPEVRALLIQFLRLQHEFSLIIVASSAEELLREMADAHPPQIALIDLGLPGMSGLDMLPLLRSRFPQTDVIVQTVFDDTDRIYQALCSGASGYVLKNAPLEQYREAILEVAQGGAYFSRAVARRVLLHFKPTPQLRPEVLSERERAVLHALVDGLSDKQVAARLDLAHATVRTHVQNIYRKLQINSRSELLTRAARGQI